MNIMSESVDKNGTSRRPRIGRVRIIIIIILTIIYFIVLANARSIPSQRFLFIFYFIFLVFVPGYSLSAVLFPGKNLPMKVVTSVVFGTALMYVVLFVFNLFRLDIFYIGIVMPVITVALARLHPFWIPDTRDEHEEHESPPPPIPRMITVLLFILVVFACVLVIRSGDPLLYTSDSPDHIAYIRTISRTQEAFPGTFLYKEGGTLTRDIRKGLGHAMWGTINVLTGRTDVLPVWPLISLFGSILIILSIFCAGVLLFQSAPIGLLAAILFVFCYHGGLTGRQLTTIAYSFPFGKIYLVAFLAALTTYVTRPRIELLLLAAAASIAATGTHINHFLLMAFLIFVFSIVAFFQAKGEIRTKLWRKTVPVLVVTFLCVNLPYLLLRYIRDYAPNNEIHTHVQGILRFTDTLFIINPVVFFRIAGPLFVLAFISVFILWNKSRLERNLSLLLWGVIAIYLTVFNPILVPLISRSISYLLIRLEFAIPSVLVSACLLDALWKRLRGRELSISVRASVIGWIAVLCCIGYPLLKTPSRFAYSTEKLSKMKSMSCRNVSDLFEAIDENVPGGTVIASDPVTSYCIPAFTDHFVVCTFDQHSIPNDSTALDRILDCRDIFLPGIGTGDMIRTLKKYNTEYLVVNGRIPASITPLYWRPDLRDAEYTIGKLSRAPKLFRVIYNKDSVALFEFLNQPYHDSLTAEPSFDERLGPTVTIGEAFQLPESGEPAVHVKAVRIDRTSVKRGDTLDITIEWVATRTLPPKSYVSHVRLDTHFEKGPLYSASYGKIYRKVLERIRGYRFRHSVVHLPFNGMYPPDKWSALRVVRDTFPVRIPDDIATGIYSISITMSIKTQYPNHTLKDIFTDNDIYSGGVMGRILVE